MTESTLTILGYICLFLFCVAATLHYSRKSIIPFVTWILVLGGVYGFSQKYFSLLKPLFKRSIPRDDQTTDLVDKRSPYLQCMDKAF